MGGGSSPQMIPVPSQTSVTTPPVQLTPGQQAVDSALSQIAGQSLQANAPFMGATTASLFGNPQFGQIQIPGQGQAVGAAAPTSTPTQTTAAPVQSQAASAAPSNVGAKGSAPVGSAPAQSPAAPVPSQPPTPTPSTKGAPPPGAAPTAAIPQMVQQHAAPGGKLQVNFTQPVGPQPPQQQLPPALGGSTGNK